MSFTRCCGYPYYIVQVLPTNPIETVQVGAKFNLVLLKKKYINNIWNVTESMAIKKSEKANG